jgi:hypothetical protein
MDPVPLPLPVPVPVPVPGPVPVLVRDPAPVLVPLPVPVDVPAGGVGVGGGAGLGVVVEADVVSEVILESVVEESLLSDLPATFSPTGEFSSLVLAVPVNPEVRARAVAASSSPLVRTTPEASWNRGLSATRLEVCTICS